MMQDLLMTLDAEVGALELLVACTQKEQQHLLAFETQGLDEVLAEKNRLLKRENALRNVRESQVKAALASTGAPAHETTLSALIKRAPRMVSLTLASRRERIRALLGALRELNQVAGYHAERQLRWARKTRLSLQKTSEHLSPTGYGRGGRPTSNTGDSYRLRGRV